MSGQDWVTLLAFGIGMVALSFINRETALIVTGTVGLVLVLRHYSSGTIVPTSGSNPHRS